MRMHLCGLLWYHSCSRIRQSKECMRLHLWQNPTAWINSSQDEPFVHEGIILGCDRTNQDCSSSTKRYTAQARLV